MSMDLERIPRFFAAWVAEHGARGACGEVAAWLASGERDQTGFSEIVKRHGVGRESWFRIQVLDLVLEYAKDRLSHGLLTIDDIIDIRLLKYALHVREGEFASADALASRLGTGLLAGDAAASLARSAILTALRKAAYEQSKERDSSRAGRAPERMTCPRPVAILQDLDVMSLPMLQRQFRIRPLTDPATARDDASFWRRQPAAARLAAIEILRRQVYGAPTRLLRTARVLQRTPR